MNTTGTAEKSIQALLRLTEALSHDPDNWHDMDDRYAAEVTEAITADFPWIETLEPQMDGPTLAVPEEADPGSEEEERRFMGFLHELFDREETAFWNLVLPERFDEQAAEFYC